MHQTHEKKTQSLWNDSMVANEWKDLESYYFFDSVPIPLSLSLSLYSNLCFNTFAIFSNLLCCPESETPDLFLCDNFICTCFLFSYMHIVFCKYSIKYSRCVIRNIDNKSKCNYIFIHSMRWADYITTNTTDSVSDEYLKWEITPIQTKSYQIRLNQIKSNESMNEYQRSDSDLNQRLMRIT